MNKLLTFLFLSSFLIPIYSQDEAPNVELGIQVINAPNTTINFVLSSIGTYSVVKEIVPLT